MKLILASKSKIKEEALKKWAKDILKKDIVIEKIDIHNKILPEQPINSGIEKTCADRIRFVEDIYPDIVLMNDYIVSIENGIEIKENKIIDKVCVKLKNIITKNIITYVGCPVEVEFKIMEKYPKIMNVINDFVTDYELTSKQYIYDGCSTTFGSLVNKYYPDIPANNWMRTLCKKGRKLQICEVLRTTYENNKLELN